MSGLSALTRVPALQGRCVGRPTASRQRLVVRAATSLPVQVDQASLRVSTTMSTPRHCTKTPLLKSLVSRLQYKTVSPVGDRIFVKIDSSESTSQGGILLPSSVQKKPTQGEVVSLGDAKSLKVHQSLTQRVCHVLKVLPGSHVRASMSQLCRLVPHRCAASSVAHLS